jgi:hypothetical protein
MWVNHPVLELSDWDKVPFPQDPEEGDSFEWEGYLFMFSEGTWNNIMESWVGDDPEA